MSDDCISRSELYKKVCEAEKLARERVLDTPSDSPFSNKLNPAYTRYSAQLDERTQFKHMIADARSVQQWIPCSERLPEEHESVWAKAKGTDRWSEAMWEKQSDEVIVTELFEDGTTRTDTACTHDGEWYVKVKIVKRKIIAWMPLPEPYKRGEEYE